VTCQSQHAAFAENLFASFEKVSTGTTPDRTLFPDHDESGNIAGLQEHEAAGNCDRLRGPAPGVGIHDKKRTQEERVSRRVFQKAQGNDA
jgi:hypothetical protein